MQAQNFTMAVIGVGNMGEALLGGVIRAGITTKDRIVVFDVDRKRSEKVAAAFGLRWRKASW